MTRARSSALVAIALLGWGLSHAGCSSSSRSGGGGGGGAAAAPPRIDGIAPTQGGAGAMITIQGSGFAAAPSGNAVFFGTAQATVSAADERSLTCAVPPGAAPGARSVTVTTAGGTSNAVSFNVLPPPAGGPTLSGLSPSSGSVGAQVVLSGSGFESSPSANRVTINGTQAAVSAASSTQLTVTVPSGATTGPVVVETSTGLSNGLTFTVTAAQGGAPGASGSRAIDYLSAATHTALLVEVDFVSGAGPDSAALDRLKLRLEERCNKPGGVTIQVDDAIPDPGISTWTLSDLRATEQTHRDHFTGGNTAVLYFLYVDGGYQDDTPTRRVLGVAYSGSSMAIFKDNVQAASALPLTQRVIERAVLVHEAGHTLGLVNNGIPMQTPHQDTANGAHDTDDQCVMHHAIETSLVAQLSGSVPDQFDARCVEDMRAAGGK